MLIDIIKKLNRYFTPESPARMRKRMKQSVRNFSQRNMRRNWFAQAEEKLW